MSDELRERIGQIMADLVPGGGYPAKAIDAVMALIREEFGEPEIEYGIQWRDDDFVFGEGNGEVDYLRRRLEGAARDNLPAKPFVRTVCYGPWRPVDLEEEKE